MSLRYLVFILNELFGNVICCPLLPVEEILDSRLNRFFTFTPGEMGIEFTLAVCKGRISIGPDSWATTSPDPVFLRTKFLRVTLTGEGKKFVISRSIRPDSIFIDSN